MIASSRNAASEASAISGARALASVAVLIPAWQPEPRLVLLVAELSQSGFGLILVVDDGSRPECRRIFTELTALPRVEFLRHAVNLGKGRALKTGFNHLLHNHPSVDAVVTADADGQHTPEDIRRVAHAFLADGNTPILGSRRFARDVPLRSRVGNLLTRRIFGFLTGTRLSDTQTGLRGLPRALLPQLLRLEGERYEYEMAVLAHLCRSGRRPVEVPIATIYLENNRGSHFNPVWDSMRIYLVLLRFGASSLLAFVFPRREPL